MFTASTAAIAGVIARRLVAPAVGLLMLLAVPASASAATYTVDNAQAAATGGACTPSITDCSLVDAINLANSVPGADTIAFNVQPDSTKPWTTIDYQGSGIVLPSITDAVTIDGTTQPGYSTTTGPEIEIRGAGITVQSGGPSTIKALAITGSPGASVDLEAGGNTVTQSTIGIPPSFPDPSVYTPPAATAGGVVVHASNNAITKSTISGNKAEGVYLAGDGNTVTGNFIGTDTTGFDAYPNGASGVRVASGTGNTIGGTAVAALNVISGNGTADVSGAAAGIQVDAAATSTAIVNNEIGVRFHGTGVANRALPNEGNGISLAGTGSTVGGTTLAAGNVISGNVGAGVLLTGAGNQVIGNLIGTDGSGEVAVPNGSGIASVANNNTIGGNTAGMKNVVSGNAGDGITIGITSGTPALVTGNVVKGNRVGSDDDGLEPVPNGGDGIYLHSTQGTTIGGTGAGEGNVISANRGRGVVVDGTSALPSQSNTIQGNRIGTDLVGVGALGNKLDGVNVGSGVTGPTTVGGTGTNAANTIAFNGSAGVRIPATVSGNVDSTGVAIRGNAIYSNGGLGIDLDAAGVLANEPIFDADTGPNGKQNYPIVQRATSGGGSTTVHAVLLSNPSQTYTIDYYSDTSCDPSHNGEGRTFLGSATITTLSGDGSQIFDQTLPTQVPPGQVVTATATDSAGSTSEFAACQTVTGAPSVSVGDTQIAENDTSNSGTVLVPVTLDHPSARTVTVDVAVQPGTATTGADYTPVAPQTISFNPGDTQRFVQVQVVDDTLNEASETVSVVASNPTNATLGHSPGTLTITDDDPQPTLSIADASVTEGTGGTSQMSFTVSLSAPSGQTVTVDAVTADGTAVAPGDYGSTRSTLTFAPGTTSRTFSVPVATDATHESDETFTAALESEQAAGVTRRQATGTIVDDDEPEKPPAPIIQTVIQQQPAPPQEPRDTQAPSLTLAKLPATIKRKDLLAKGISFDVTPDEAASFDIALVGRTKTVTLARAGDATLADATLPQAAGKRTVKLKLPAALKRAFTRKAVKLELRIVAYDAAGNRTLVTKRLTVR